MSEHMNPAVAVPSPDQIRDELTDMVVKDLLGPAGGPEEELSQHEDRVTGRYLVGALAPKSQRIQPEEMDELGTGEQDDPEVGASDVLAAPTDSFFPISMGLSFVVVPDAEAVLVKTEWGRYEKKESQTQTKADGSPARAFHRTPHVGEPWRIPLAPGPFGPFYPGQKGGDPLVAIQGRIRKTSNGWIVTVFMVNTEDEPKRGKDAAWIFQPKMRVVDAADPARAIFVQRRDWRHDLTKMDRLTREETETLEMLYRRRLEFAVGHGTSVHATLPAPDADHAVMIETEFVPRAEVEQHRGPLPGLPVPGSPGGPGTDLERELADGGQASFFLDNIRNYYWNCFGDCCDGNWRKCAKNSH